MITYVFKSLCRRLEHVVLVILGLLVVGIGLALFVSTSRTSTQLTAGELQRYWRTSYDLLVRPPRTATATEQEYGLVRANYLSGLYGGISIEQYETIRNLPDIEVAAPIAMVGYLSADPHFVAGLLEPGHLYRSTRTITATDNVREYVTKSVRYFWMEPPSVSRVGDNIYIGTTPAGDREATEELRKLEGAGLQVNKSGRVSYSWGGHSLFLLAGIDPEQEAKLIGFDDALLKGQFFGPENEVQQEDLGGTMELRFPSGEVESYSYRYLIPLLINSHVYAQAQAQFTISRLQAPDRETVFSNTLQSGRAYLDALPLEEQLASREMGLEEAYRWVFETLASPQKGEPAPVLGDWEPPEEVRNLLQVYPSNPFGLANFQRPGEVAYHSIPFPFAGQSESVLAALPIDIASDGQMLFRTTQVWPFRHPHKYDVVGAFDIAKLRDPYGKDLNAVPMETYRPPVVTLRYDEEGHPVEPVQIIPTLNPEGYILVPPYALTTIEGARVFAGDDCISAIRVRVSGVETLNEESWARILAVAQEIRDLTGLQVDTTLGSSPTPLLVHLPGIGYVEEPWVKTGVSISIHRGFNRADLIFLVTMFGVCGLYVFSMSSVNALGRRREIGLLAALGWRQVATFGSLLTESLLLALVVGLLGMLLSLAAITLFHLGVPPEQTALAFPVGLTLYLLGSFYPAWRAARQSPVSAIRAGELHHHAPRAARIGRLTPLSYGLRNALQRLNRTALSAVGMMVSTGLVVLFLLVSLEMGGLLEGTLLGVHIAVQIRPYHYVMGGVCFAVSALALADVMLLNVMERRREIGTLKAVGWQTGTVIGLFIREGVLLGLLGGVLGDALSVAIFAVLYRALSPATLWIAVVGMALPAGVGALAALYPAHVAAKVPPAEAVRYE